MFTWTALNISVTKPVKRDVHFKVDTFTNQQAAFDIVEKAQDQPYCFALHFNEFDTAADKYEVAFSFDKFEIPDTNLVAYNPVVQAPDLAAWGKWFKVGVPQLYAYVSEFIGRVRTAEMTASDQAAFDAIIASPVPLFQLQTGYAPLESRKFINISPEGASQLA